MAQTTHTVRDWAYEAGREIAIEVATRFGMDWAQGRGREGKGIMVKPSPNLAEALAEIGEEVDENHMAELAAWLDGLVGTRKKQLDEISKENLKKILKLPLSKRNNILKAFPRPLTERIEERLSDESPEFPGTTSAIQRFGEWGRKRLEQSGEAGEPEQTAFQSLQAWWKKIQERIKAMRKRGIY